MNDHRRASTAPSTGASAIDRLVRLVALVAVALTIVFAVQLPTAAAGPLEDAVAELETAEATTGTLIAQRDALEAQYKSFVAEIEKLKSSGGIVNDYELQTKLRQARSMADSLTALTSRIQAQRKTEDAKRRTVIKQYDVLISKLESRLVGAPADEQATIIARLETLQNSRESFRRALAVTPDTLEPIDVPDLGDFVSDDPEELVAAADELADNGEKLRSQLEEVESRIDALERRRRLVAYAEDSADEANLFDEEARSTRVRGSRSSNQGSAANENEKAGGATQGVDRTANEPTASPTRDADLSADDDADGAAPPSDPEPGLFAGDAQNESAAGGPTLDSQPGDTSADLGSGPAVPPADSGSDGVIRSDADPNVITGRRDAADRGGDSDDELKRLKKHRRRLERSISKAADQEERLRNKARSIR